VNAETLSEIPESNSNRPEGNLMSSYWYEIDQINQDKIKYVIILATYKARYIIIKNKKRGGWEIPGGNRETGESILAAASRELFEETGAYNFDIEPYGVYELNGSFGVVFFSNVLELTDLPDYGIEEIKFVEELPENLNFDTS